jgi:hypothetical protein
VHHVKVIGNSPSKVFKYEDVRVSVDSVCICPLAGNIWRCVTVDWTDATVVGRGRRKRIGGRKIRKRIGRGRCRRQNRIRIESFVI